MLIKKKNSCHQANVAILANQRVKIKEREKIDKYLIKTVSTQGDGDINYSWHARKSPRGFGKDTSGIRNQFKNGDHPDHSSF